jgi:hypothetical protein
MDSTGTQKHCLSSLPKHEIRPPLFFFFSSLFVWLVAGAGLF